MARADGAHRAGTVAHRGARPAARARSGPPAGPEQGHPDRLSGVQGKPVRAAVFDLDGTIADSEPRSRLALRRLFEHYGVLHDDELLARFVGRRGPEVFAELGHLFPGRHPVQLSAEVDRKSTRLNSTPAN